MPPRKKTAVVKPSVEKKYEDDYATYTAKYGPNVAILMKVGSFYSMYDKIHVETGRSLRNVREVAEACAGAPHIEKADGEWNDVMWGFPEQSLWRYEQLMIQAGYTVVKISQDRDETARVTGRSLESVVSPGTYIDSNVLAEERRVVGVLVEAFKTREGKIAWQMASTGFAVATGECISIETVVGITEGRPNLDALEAFWSANAPSELVVWTRDISPTGKCEPQASNAGRGDVTLTEHQIRPWFAGTFRGPIHVHEAPQRSAATTRGAQAFLHRVYARDTALRVGTYLDVENYQTAMECLAFLLQWIEDHNPSYLVNLRNHAMWEPAEELILGNAALQQLGMLPLAKPHECLLHWLQRAITAMGRRALRERCVRPITDVATLEDRQMRIAALRPHAAALKTHFFNMADLPKIYRRFHMGQGDREGLLGMLVTAKKAAGLHETMSSMGLDHPMPAEAKDFVANLLETWDADRIRLCDTDHSLGLGPHHPWKRGRHANLDRLEDAWCSVRTEVETTVEAWNDMLDEENAVKVSWCKESAAFEWVTTKRRAIALATSLKSRRRYVLEHQGKGATNAILTSEHLTALSARAKDVWEQWTVAAEAAWKHAWSTWEGNYDLVEWIADVDVDAALARCAEEYGYVRPTYVVADTAHVSVTDLRHPILERIHTDTPYIAHSLALGCASTSTQTATATATAGNGMLLYGVNAAGKSSLSKAVGLAVLMAQIGMPVPASTMSIAPYNGLYTRILGNDNLWAGMSSFVVEMTELRTILNAGTRALVLGDELCAGTETTSAIAIVGAGILRLVEKGAHFIFATHLHELLEVEEIAGLPTVKPYHLSVRAEGNSLVYDRVLREGRGPAIYGLEVCRGLDMDPVFLEKAATLRRRWDGGVDLGKVSRYNAAVSVQVCDICQAHEGLETHHIMPQATADAAGFVAAGRHKNEKGNLAVLCQACHDRHHRGEIEILGWQATTTGRKLAIETPMPKKMDLSRFKYVPKK